MAKRRVLEDITRFEQGESAMTSGRNFAKSAWTVALTMSMLFLPQIGGGPAPADQSGWAQAQSSQGFGPRQGILRQRLRQRIMGQSGSGAGAATATGGAGAAAGGTGSATGSDAGATGNAGTAVTGDTAAADPRSQATKAAEKEAWFAEMRRQKHGPTTASKCTIAGLDVAVWRPKTTTGPVPLVIFSHGFHGINTQSDYIMRALADAGYIVMAPNHEDAFTKGLHPPEMRFQLASQWTDTTYRRRGNDITRLLAALKADKEWSHQIDMTRIALMGHSLGGYTVLALAGGWPQWKLPGIKAVVALSPYCSPFLVHKTLSNISVPVMYQGGTKDWGITPFLLGKNGAYTSTPSPAVLVEVQDANHFTWSGLNKDQDKAEIIDYYCVSFLDKYVKGDTGAHPEKQLQGVCRIEAK